MCPRGQEKRSATSFSRLSRVSHDDATMVDRNAESLSGTLHIEVRSIEWFFARAPGEGQKSASVASHPIG